MLKKYKYLIILLLTAIMFVGCCGTKQEKNMTITVNIRYTGTDGSAL